MPARRTPEVTIVGGGIGGLAAAAFLDLTGTCVGLYGEETYTAHRADLLDAIRSAVPGGSLRLGKRCVEVRGVRVSPARPAERAAIRGQLGVVYPGDEVA